MVRLAFARRSRMQQAVLHTVLPVSSGLPAAAGSTSSTSGIMAAASISRPSARSSASEVRCACGCACSARSEESLACTAVAMLRRCCRSTGALRTV